MPLYEVSGRTTLVTATVAAPLCGLRAVTGACRVWEIHAFWVTAATTSGGIGLCYSTAIGTGTLTPSTAGGVARGRMTGTSAATAILVTNWGTLAPTNAGIGAVFKRFTCGPAIGNGIIWTFDREPLEVVGSAGATSELCIVNLNATAPGTLDISVVYGE